MFCRREVEVIYFRIIPVDLAYFQNKPERLLKMFWLSVWDLIYSISAITSNPAAFSVTSFISYLLLQACLSLSSLQIFSNKIKS